jgi:hypothetical protein
MGKEINVSQDNVRAAHKHFPEYGATQLAHMLGCSDAYVRATAQRLDLRLPRSPYGAVPSVGAQKVRERRARQKSTE